MVRGEEGGGIWLGERRDMVRGEEGGGIWLGGEEGYSMYVKWTQLPSFRQSRVSFCLEEGSCTNPSLTSVVHS